MARISTYPIISTPTVDDLLIGTDVNDLNITKNFTIGEIGGLIGQDYVPYVGATGNVNLGSFNITASAFIIPGGLASQFVKADGSLDSTVYTPQTRTLTINGTTYNLSANRSWDLNTIDTLTTTGTSGAATYIGKVLNIPVYQAQGAYITQLSGEATGSGPGNASVILDNTAVISKVLTGLNVTGGTIVSTDTILQAFGKVQNQINGLAGGVEYQGTWNAATNVPFLQSSVGTQGYYYVVNVAGNTNLNGITDWRVGDWAIFNGTSWDKVDNTDAVVSVNGYVGAVVLTSSDVGAVPTGRTLTINGVGYDLSADRSWTVGDVRTDGSYANPSWITSLAWSKITGTPTTLAGYGITDGALNTRTLTINGTTYDLTANRTWNVGTVTSVGTSGPLTGGTITGSGTIGITQSSSTTDGYLSSADWNAFNSKQAAISVTAPITLVSGVLGITQSGASTDGYLSSTDWNTFNSKVSGSGTANTLPMWGSASSLINSPLSYAADTFNFQYNSATGGTVVFTNSNGAAYAYTIQMNNFGSPRSTVHSYTDGLIIQSIGGTQVSRMFANGNLILGTGTVDNGYKLEITGNLYVSTISNATVDTDRFIVSDGGVIKYRTGAEILADIGAQGALTLTTTGTSGPATLISNTLNIPNYGSALTGYVPYTGATQDLNLGTFGLIGDFVQFNPSSSNIPSAEGVMSWDNTDGTVRLSVKGNTYSVPIGQSVIARVHNSTGTNLLRTNYQVVKVAGAQGQRLAVSLAQANNDANSASTLGLVCENISNNQEGFIVNIGTITNINTTGNLQGETWLDGDVLYLSPTILGAITKVKPAAPQHTVIIGYVEYAHANNGKIYVKIDNGYELEELHDVAPTPYVNNGLLYRDTTLNLWKSATISTILGYTPAPQGNYITSLTGEATASGPGAANVTLSNSAVTGKVLTGLNITGNAIVSTDSILTAFGKLQHQVNQLVGGLQYEGTWNASTNTPTITSSVGTDGTFYIVSVAGTTNINGINDWQVGDWIVFHDTAWQKVDNSDSVSSVFGRVGNIVANQADYSAFYPLIGDIKDGILTVQGTGVLSGSGTFSANQATNNTITITHAAVSRTDTTSSQTPSFGGSFTAIDSVTSSAEGHVTAINTKTVTVPSTTASAVQTGLLSSTDWSTFNSKQNALTLTTTGSSGAATLVGSTLNIPIYSPDLSGYVPTSRTITINGTTQDLSANRTFNVGTVTSVGLSSATSGVTIGSTPVTTSGTITLAIATASGSQNGLLSSTDWTTFNNKQNALTNPVTGTGTTNYLPKFTGASTIGNSQVFDNGTNVGIGTASPNSILELSSTTPILRIQASSTSDFHGLEFRQGAGLDATIKQLPISGEFRISNGRTTGWGGFTTFYIDTAEAARFTPSKNLLVGTTTDNGARLQVSGSATIGGNLTVSSGNNLNMVTGDIYFQSNGGYGILSANASRLLVIQNSAFGVNGKLTITADAANEQFLISRASNTNAQLILGYHSDGYGRIQAVEQNVAFRPLVLNQSGGNVGIGTTSPSFQLHVNRAGNTGIFLSNTTGNSAGYLYAGGLDGLEIQSVDSSNSIAKKLMLNPYSGNVLVGTTSDAGYKLDVNGTGRFSSDLTHAGASATSILNIYTVGGTVYNYTGVSGSTNSIINGSVLGDTVIRTINKSILFSTNNGSTSALTLASTGAATFSSSVTAGRFISSTSSSYTNDFLNLNIGTVGQTIGLRFGYDGSTYNKGAIYFISKSANGVGDLIFAANNSESSANVSTSDERMRITSGGNVLIGTTTDVGARLYVDGSFRTGTLTAGTQTAAVDWRLGNARGGTATANALIRVQINGVLVDLIGNYV